MTYKETTEYLFNQLPMYEQQGKDGYKSGLENTIALDEYFGCPHKSFKTIHVAGTNGKGSCSHTLSAILQMCGYRVGLYTSPHLVDFRERIRVNGIQISEDYVVNFVNDNREFFEPLHPTFFELTTAMAFKYFKDSKVDIAIIETGLGGRLDCTNIITPILSVITNISFDHTQFLGDTLEKIAGEKAGIIKKGTPVVVGETTDETRPVFEQKAKKMDAPIVFAEDDPEVIETAPQTDGTLLYKTKSFGDLVGEQSGLYQMKNTNTILTAVKEIIRQGYLVACDDKSNLEKSAYELRHAFSDVAHLTGLAGRWQTITKSPLVVCDTGHNLAAWEYLSRQISQVKCKNLHIVFGMVDDKDIDGVINLLPKDAKYYFTQANNRRALSAETLANKAAIKGLYGTSYPTVKEAFDAAKYYAEQYDFIFVGGSTYIVADFLENCI